MIQDFFELIISKTEQFFVQIILVKKLRFLFYIFRFAYLHLRHKLIKISLCVLGVAVKHTLAVFVRLLPVSVL